MRTAPGPGCDGEVGVGVVIDGDGVDVGFLLVGVVAIDVELLSLVEVDRVGVDEHGGAELVHLADDAGAGVVGLVDDHDVVARGGAEADRFGGVGLVGPVPDAIDLLDDAVLFEHGERGQHCGWLSRSE